MNTFASETIEVIEEIGYEIITVVGVAGGLLFAIGWMIGRKLRTTFIRHHVYAFRWINAIIGIFGSGFFLIELIPDDIETLLTILICFITYLIGINTGFEKKWMIREMFSKAFWTDHDGEEWY